MTRVEAAQTHYQFVFERLLPLAQESAQASGHAFRVGTGSVLELLTSQRALRQAQSILHEHLAEYKSALAELESIMGTPVEAAAAPDERAVEK